MSRANWKRSISLKRSTVITPSFLNKSILVHNGQFFIPVLVSSDRIGHKFGEFVPSKKPAIYSK